MSARNDITGDAIQSKALSKEGRENFDRIFRKNTKWEKMPSKEGWQKFTIDEHGNKVSVEYHYGRNKP